MEHRINQRRRPPAAIAAAVYAAAAITIGSAPITDLGRDNTAHGPSSISVSPAADQPRTALLVPKRVRLIINYQRTAVV